MRSRFYKVSVFLIAVIANTVLAFSTSSRAFANPSLSSSSSSSSSRSSLPMQQKDIRSNGSLQHVRLRKKTALIQQGAVAIGREHVVPLDHHEIATSTKNSNKTSSWLHQLEQFLGMDKIVCTAYLCNILALSLPIMLVPIAASEMGLQAGIAASSSSSLVTSQVARISSIAAAGGAAGKFINGFVCNEFGTFTCSKWYLTALAVCSLAFSMSTNPLTMGIAFGSMEFFASVQCASLACILLEYYKDNAVKMTKALTLLGLSATVGEILAKVLGTGLSHMLHWRQVSQFGSLVALLGAFAISRAPGRHAAKQEQEVSTTRTTIHNKKKSFSFSSVWTSLQVVMGSSLFWKIALAYSMAFVASCSDRILGPFYHSVTGLPHNLCGSLTLSVTLGLVLGLATGSNKITHMKSLVERKSFFQRRYIHSILATFGLAVTAGFGPIFISSKLVLATIVALLTATMAGNIAFQCYQFPAMIANDPQFQGHQAVCMSFLDGFGYLFSVPIFAALGHLVPHHGWSSGFGLLTALFGAGAILMVRNLVPILSLNGGEEQQQQPQPAAVVVH